MSRVTGKSVALNLQRPLLAASTDRFGSQTLTFHFFGGGSEKGREPKFKLRHYRAGLAVAEASRSGRLQLRGALDELHKSDSAARAAGA